MERQYPREGPHIQPGSAQQQVYQFHLNNPPIAARLRPGKEVNRRVQIGMQLSCLRQAALCPEAASLGLTVTRKHGTTRREGDERQRGD